MNVKLGSDGGGGGGSGLVFRPSVSRAFACRLAFHFEKQVGLQQFLER